MQRPRHRSPVVAVIYAGLGDKERAFAWLNRAYEARSYLMAIYLNTDARLDNLHSDPRFKELKRRFGLPIQERAHRGGCPRRATINRCRLKDCVHFAGLLIA